jgi:hypothetical protein
VRDDGRDGAPGLMPGAATQDPPDAIEVVPATVERWPDVATLL